MAELDGNGCGGVKEPAGAVTVAALVPFRTGLKKSTNICGVILGVVSRSTGGGSKTGEAGDAVSKPTGGWSKAGGAGKLVVPVAVGSTSDGGPSSSRLSVGGATVAGVPSSAFVSAVEGSLRRGGNMATVAMNAGDGRKRRGDGPSCGRYAPNALLIRTAHPASSVQHPSLDILLAIKTWRDWRAMEFVLELMRRFLRPVNTETGSPDSLFRMVIGKGGVRLSEIIARGAFPR